MNYIADVIVLALFLGLSYLVLSTSENVPVWDSWQNPRLLDLMLSGNLGISDLYENINGHRVFFPRLLMLTLGYLSDYDVRLELLVNLILGLGIYFIYRNCFRKTPGFGSKLYLYTSAVISILVLSLVQYENWYSGWQSACFMCIAMSLLSLRLLMSSAASAYKFSAAIIAACIANYSFASGMLVWPLGLIALIYQKSSHRYIAVWLGVGILCLATYFQGLQGESNFHISEIHRYFIYVLAYLGAPIASHNPVLAMIWAVIGLLGFLYLLFVSRIDDLGILLVLFCLFSILTGWLISFARLQYGMEYALLSRYTSFATIYWASLCILILKRTSVINTGFEKNVMFFLVSMIALSSIKTSLGSVKEFYIHEKRMQMAIRELKKDNPGMINRHLVKNISWDVDYTLQQAEILKKHRLSLYSD